MNSRTAEITAFLTAYGWAGAERRVLADDASFRRYDRVTHKERCAVLMDAPPDREDVRPFLAVAKILRDLNLSAPEILEQDPERGFLLLEDFGDDTYTRVLAARPALEESLYMLAVDLLIALHREFKGAATVPQYDDTLLTSEANILLDWYIPAVTGKTISKPLRHDYRALWEALFPLARSVPETLVLRDYHVDNLIWLPNRRGVAACGLLDFQDAVIGPATYDMVSLLEDARRDVPTTLAKHATERYLAAFPEICPNGFRLSQAILGAQRSAKILGIFARLDRRDGKPDYLRHLPRVWRLLEADLAHPKLAGIREWFDHVLPPACRIAPKQATNP